MLRHLFGVWNPDARAASAGPGPAYRNTQRMGMRPLRGTIVFPADADLVKNFGPIIEQLSRAKGFVPASLKIEFAEALPAPPPGWTREGARYALATGQIDPDGKGMQHMFRVIGAAAPDRYGDFSYHDFVAYFPRAGVAEANATARMNAVGAVQGMKIPIHPINPIHPCQSRASAGMGRRKQVACAQDHSWLALLEQG